MTGARRIVETPWGVDVEATVRPDGKGGETLVFDHPATAVMMGIHDPERRASYVLDAEDAERAGAGPGTFAELIDAYYGFAAPRIALEPPAAPLYPLLRKQLETPALTALDGWCDRIADAPGWRRRAPELVKLLQALTAAGSRPGPWHVEDPAAMGAHMARTLTAILEHLGEPEIVRIEQAAFYALTEHQRWRLAAINWAGRCRTTWLRDWIKARPAYRKAVRLISQHHAPPAWFWRW